MSISLFSRMLTYPHRRPIGDIGWYDLYQLVPGVRDSGVFRKHTNFFSQEFTEAIEKEQCLQRTYALMILIDGAVAFEWHCNDHARTFSNSKSMAKTVLALLIGIAQSEGHLDIDQAACDFIEEWRKDERRHIKIKHLLSMQSGLLSDLAFSLSDPIPPVLRLYFGRDVIAPVVNARSVEPPGHRWVYNNINSQALGIILQRATAQPYSEYLSSRLWKRIECKDAFVWPDHDNGLARTFSGLFARPEDWARIGELIRRHGVWGSDQVVPGEWIHQMEVPRNPDGDYGYHIWLKAHRKRKVCGIPEREHFLASADHKDPSTVYLEGMHAQQVFVSRDHQLVLVRIGEKPNKKKWDNSSLINSTINELYWR